MNKQQVLFKRILFMAHITELIKELYTTVHGLLGKDCYLLLMYKLIMLLVVMHFYFIMLLMQQYLQEALTQVVLFTLLQYLLRLIIHLPVTLLYQVQMDNLQCQAHGEL